MIADVKFLQQKFAEYNKMIFNDQLPMIPIELSRAKSFLGQFAYRRKRKLLGGWHLYDLRIKFSIRIDLPQNEIEDTLIHEMLHYYIAHKGIKDSSTHGHVFRAMMQDINTRYGRNLSVSHRMTSEQREQAIDTRHKWHVIAVVGFADGRKGIKVLPRVRESILRYRNGILSSPTISSVTLYMSNNPFFNRYPCSSSFKVYYLEESVIQENLKEAESLTL